jgi:ubiquitin carboxyl-terminal hydrolase 7
MIKPSPESGWFKFDDDRVIPVTIREVFDDNFGGKPSESCAYILIYFRKSNFNDIFVESKPPVYLGMSPK